VMSGEDEKLGGGLYWREQELKSKNTCTNAPAIVSALRLHQLTGKDEYLETAERLYRWTAANLQDKDGLFWDNIRMNGSIDKRKYSYNSALMIRASTLFHLIKDDPQYLEEARRIADAADRRWVRDNGAIADGGRFAHLLIEALLKLHQVDGDDRWLEIGLDAVAHVRENLRDPHGRYPSRWDREIDGPVREVNLLDQASAARAYWMFANQLNLD